MKDSVARSRRRRHGRRGADGRIRGQGAFRGDDAEGGDGRPRGFQPVIEAIIRLAEKAAKEPRDLPPSDSVGGREGGARDRRSGSARRLYDHPEAGALRRRRRGQGEGHWPRSRPKAAEPKFSGREVAEAFHDAQAKVVRWNILDHKRRIDGRDLTTVRPILAAGRRPAAHPRLGSVHPRRDAGAGRGDARHRRGRAISSTRSKAPTRSASCSTTTSRPIRSARRAAWVRPGRREIGHGKLAWRAIHPMLPTPAEFPYTIRVVSEITEFERLLVDGDGLRLLAGADGRRRAAEAPDRRHRHGPHPRRQALRRALRHPRRRGPSRRHGLQGRRHQRGRHLAADGHQDRRHHRGDHAASRSPRRATAACTSSAR